MYTTSRPSGEISRYRGKEAESNPYYTRFTQDRAALIEVYANMIMLTRRYLQYARAQDIYVMNTHSRTNRRRAKQRAEYVIYMQTRG